MNRHGQPAATLMSSYTKWSNSEQPPDLTATRRCWENLQSQTSFRGFRGRSRGWFWHLNIVYCCRVYGRLSAAPKSCAGSFPNIYHIHMLKWPSTLKASQSERCEWTSRHTHVHIWKFQANKHFSVTLTLIQFWRCLYILQVKDTGVCVCIFRPVYKDMTPWVLFVEGCVYKYVCVDVHLQDSEAASCKMNSLGSNHSIPSTSVSTGSQSSSVNSMQEVLDDSCSDMTMMHPQDYSSTLESSPHTKKVKARAKVGQFGGGDEYWGMGDSLNITPNHQTWAGNWKAVWAVLSGSHNLLSEEVRPWSTPPAVFQRWTSERCLDWMHLKLLLI